jgi:hypothetical protein
MMVIDLLLLAGLAICIIASAVLWMQRVLPALATFDEPEVYLDVWLPVALALPFTCLALITPTSVVGIGWAPVAAPIVLAAFIVPAVLLVGSGTHAEADPDRHRESSRLAWARTAALGTGLVLLLLSASHTLTVWVGQCLFAGAATLMWINVPPGDPQPRGAGRSNEVGGSAEEPDDGPGLSTMGLLLLGFIAGGLAALLDPAWRWIGLSGLCLVPAVVLARAVVLLPRERALRLALWTATLGPLIGIGILSAIRLVPQSIAIIASPMTTPADGRIATGFGGHVPEAVLLILLAALVGQLSRVRRSTASGFLLVLGIAGLAIFRIFAAW